MFVHDDKVHRKGKFGNGYKLNFDVMLALPHISPSTRILSSSYLQLDILLLVINKISTYFHHLCVAQYV
jgi:hypothetical protein